MDGDIFPRKLIDQKFQNGLDVSQNRRSLEGDAKMVFGNPGGDVLPRGIKGGKNRNAIHFSPFSNAGPQATEKA